MPAATCLPLVAQCRLRHGLCAMMTVRVSMGACIDAGAMSHHDFFSTELWTLERSVGVVCRNSWTLDFPCHFGHWTSWTLDIGHDQHPWLVRNRLRVSIDMHDARGQL